MAMTIKLSQSRWDALSEREQTDFTKSLEESQCCLEIVINEEDEV